MFDSFNNINYECKEIAEKRDNFDFMDIDEPQIPQRDIFKEMMQSRNKRVYPAPKAEDGERFTRKDELFNEVVKIFEMRKVDFLVTPMETKSDEATYCVNVITKALWYITNDHDTINNAHKHHPTVVKIPTILENLDGFNNLKRKKQKADPLDRNLLHSYSEALYSFLI